MKFGRRAAIAALAGGVARLSAAEQGLRLGLGVADLSDETLKFVSQIGVEWLDAPARPQARGSFRPLVPPPGQPPKGAAQAITESDLAQVVSRAKAFGLQVGIVALHAMPNVILGNSERDRDLEAVRKSIRAAGAAGIPVVEYNFYALRASAGYYSSSGRGGAGIREFDGQRIAADAPLPELGRVSAEAMWERLAYFLKAVIPEAERARVKLALHPNDPPVPEYRGVAQAIATPEDLRRVVELVPSESNGITLDTGVTRENGADVPATIREFGRLGRIHHVHFRNVKMHKERERYTETFIDDGDIDMLEAMRAFDDVRYPHMLIPDHTPAIAGDTPGKYAGWSYAVGYMKALIKAAGT